MRLCLGWVYWILWFVIVGVIVNVGIDVLKVVIMKLKLDNDRKVFFDCKGKGWFVEKGKGKFVNEDMVFFL